MSCHTHIHIQTGIGSTIFIDAQRLASDCACKNPAIEKKLDYIITHMATPAHVTAAAEDLKAAVTQEKIELTAKLDAQQATIDALKAQIETGENPALDASVALLVEQTAAIRAFVTPPEVPAA